MQTIQQRACQADGKTRESRVAHGQSDDRTWLAGNQNGGNLCCRRRTGFVLRTNLAVHARRRIREKCQPSKSSTSSRRWAISESLRFLFMAMLRSF